MAARITLKTVNAELARHGIQTVLSKASGYFYFHTGEAADWLDRTLRVANISALTLEEWVAEFHRLKKVNAEIMRQTKHASSAKSKRER